MVSRIFKANLVDERHLYAEERLGNVGFTIEEDKQAKFIPETPGDDLDAEIGSKPVVLYYDFILLVNGAFKRHVTWEPLADRIERELMEGTIIGPITRNLEQNPEAETYITPNDRFQAQAISVSALNARVDLGVVNPLELDEGMDRAERILAIHE